MEIQCVRQTLLESLGVKVYYYEFTCVGPIQIVLSRGGGHVIQPNTFTIEEGPWAPDEPPERLEEQIETIAEALIRASLQPTKQGREARKDSLREYWGGKDIPQPGSAFVYQLRYPTGSIWGAGCTEGDPAEELILTQTLKKHLLGKDFCSRITDGSTLEKVP